LGYLEATATAKNNDNSRQLQRPAKQRQRQLQLQRQRQLQSCGEKGFIPILLVVVGENDGNDKCNRNGNDTCFD